METNTDPTKSLLERFERDILYDCHSLRARISRSEALETILATKGIIPDIATYLKSNEPDIKAVYPLLAEDLRKAWIYLVNNYIDEHLSEKRSFDFDSFGEMRDYLNGYKNEETIS